MRNRRYEEANQVRRLQFEELSLRQKRDPNTVSRLLKQNSTITESSETQAEEREFHDPDTARSPRCITRS